MFSQIIHNKTLGIPNRPEGYSVIEVLVVIAIIGILFSIAVPAYENYQDEQDFIQAKQEILVIQKTIDRYFIEHNDFPESLTDIGMQDFQDPWGTPYFYVKIAGFVKSSTKEKVRKDKKLKPVNSDFDLYSAGKDGETKAAFTAKSSRDDIVRCNNGQFLGYAKDY